MNRLVGVIVLVNGGIALGGLYVALRLWRWKQAWATLADVLTAWEQDLPQTLAALAVPDLASSRQRLLILRQRYRLLRRWLSYWPHLRWAMGLVMGPENRRRRPGAPFARGKTPPPSLE